MATKISGEKITELGHFIIYNGEKVKIGILKKENGNARLFRKSNKQEIKGVFAIVQWFGRGEELEKIAYNTEAATVEEAEKEMAICMPRLQYHEFKERSVLLEIINYDESAKGVCNV